MARRPRFRRKPPSAIPSRETPKRSGIDTSKLNAALSSTAKDKESGRDKALTLLKDTRARAMDDVRISFEAGRLGGLETARIISAIHDDIIQALYTFATDHVFPAPNSEKLEQMAVCAVGGYGRGEMAPGSDLDLLFVLPDKKGSTHTEKVTEYMLYILWDMGLKVGNSVRTVDQNIALAKADQTILTSLLDLRFLSGNEALATLLFRRFRKNVTRGKGRAFITAKLLERDVRHEREGNSRYVIEPNIKEGKGGLRDLHVLYWIANFLDKDGKITDPQRAIDYVGMGLFDEKAATRFAHAADFLWRTRIHLHFAAGRPSEVLSFDKQTILARKMGHAAGPVEVAVEKFMREYFNNARSVGALTRIACAKLEAEKSLRLPKGLDSILPNSRRNMNEEGFVLDHGRLMFDDEMSLRQQPDLIMRLFEIAGRRNLDIHPDALTAIDFRRNLIDHNFRKDPEISKIFQKILLGAKAPYATLKIMNEAGVLGRYLLEFGGIVARTQFNMHHAYTVDEHTLRLVNFLHDLESGYLEDENPLATQICEILQERQRRILYMACLLHDTGKGVGDQCVEGARLSRRAARRLGLDQSEIESISWLVRRHLDLSETAQRRDISDPETIETFGNLVGSMSRLNMLFLLTIVDIRAVGPGVWNDWKARLLRDLYLNTQAYIEGRDDLEPAAKARGIREQLTERLPGSMASRIKPILDDLGQAFWQGFDMPGHVRHARFFDLAMETGVDNLVQYRVDKPRDVTELSILTRDRPGLFADLAQVISAGGAQIVGARLHTGENGRVMNMFYLQNNDGLAFGRINQKILNLLKDKVDALLVGTSSKFKPQPQLISRRAAAIPVRPKVKIFEGQAPKPTIVEIEGRDRPGLLYAVAACLRDANLDVLSAHIEVVGTLAIDAFYVKPADGTALNPKALRKELMSLLQETQTASAA